MQHLFTIPDTSAWAVTAAREAFNASLPPTISEIREQVTTEQQSQMVEVDGQLVGQMVDVQVTRQISVQVPNPALLTTNNEYLDHVLSGAINSWAKQHVQVAPPPVIEPIFINGVPQSVSMQQAQQEMLYTPTILAETPPLLDVISSAINAMGNSLDERSAKLAWQKSGSVERNHPLITQLKPLIMNVMGITTDVGYNAFVDQMFINASKRVTG